MRLQSSTQPRLGGSSSLRTSLFRANAMDVPGVFEATRGGVQVDDQSGLANLVSQIGLAPAWHPRMIRVVCRFGMT
jgi:hypothetical protein